MGLFSFIKEAGAKVGIGDNDKEVKAEQEAKLADLDQAIALKAYCRDMGLAVDDVKFEVSGSKVTATGETSSQAEKEKIVLAVGNTEGIDAVDDQIAVEKAAMSDAARAALESAVATSEAAAADKAKADVIAARAAALAPKAVFYTVVKGDTLSGISKEQYGDAMRYPEIFEANKPMLKDPDLIYPGQVLRIPQ